MKNFLALLIVSTMILIGCGGGAKDTNTTTEKKSEPKVEVKKELIVAMKIGEEELKFTKASFLSNAMTPADKTTEYTLYATPEGGDKDAFNLDFDSAKKGESQEAYISLKNYTIIKSELTLESFEAEKHMVSSAKATFSGQLKMHGANGFPTGEPIDFTGSFIQ